MAAQRRVVLPFLLVLLVMAAFAMAPRPANADTTPVLDGTWYYHDESGFSAPQAQPFTFASSGDVEITVTDLYCMGDVYEVFDNGQSLGTTSPVGLTCNPYAEGPEEAIAEGFSSGVFTVGAGSHVITFVPVQQVSGGSDWQLYVKFEGDAVIGPHWEVRATIGGGNIYNSFLPEYTPGNWSMKNVGVYLYCVPGDAPIDLLRADRSVIFKDGTHTYSTKPTDTCVDENGLAAPPIVEWGPIMVDTKAPTCAFVPSTYFVPRGTEATFEVTLSVADATSGILDGDGNYTSSGGAIVHTVSLGGTEPNYTMLVYLTMPNSTAGRVEVHFTVNDAAGNTGNCKLVIRAK